MQTSSSPVLPAAVRQDKWRGFLLCCFVFICGLRVFLIESYGAPIAWGDDLDGIAHRILARLHNATFTWPLLFAAHNGDHVIVATRLWEILWYYINGEWDPKLVMIVKTPIYAAAMTIFVHLLTRGLDRGRLAAAAVLTVLFAFPFNYHNLLWAFQSQFDFFFLTAALGCLALSNGRPGLALVAAAVAPFTLGAGPVLAASYIPFFLAAAFIGKTWSARKAFGFSAAALVIALAGMSFRTADAMPATGTAFDKGATLVKLYGWPFSNLLSAVERLPGDAHLIPRPVLNFPSAESSWMLGFAEQLHRHAWLVVAVNFTAALFVMAPLLFVLVRVARKKISADRVLGLLNVSVFTALMLAATAIARTEQPTIAMRFLDHVILAGFASIVAAFILVAQNRRWLPWVAGWALVLSFGYLATMGATMSQMVNRQKPQRSLEILQRYYAPNEIAGVQRNNHAALRENDGFTLFIVSPDPTEFMQMLDDPALRPVLPRAITAPGTGRGWAALVASAVARWGLLIAFVAACVAGWLAMRAQRTQRRAAPTVVPAAPA